jgi:sporulation protein YlmC with PRC-barrel domain
MIRASDLIGAVVRTEGGERLGRVHDLRAHASDGGWLLMGLVTGPRGLLARFEGGEEDAAVRAGRVIPWEAVTRLEQGLVVVRDEVAAAP